MIILTNTFCSASEQLLGITTLLSPFDTECEKLEVCTALGNDLGMTTSTCCTDLNAVAGTIISGEKRDVAANAQRCDTRWACFDKFALALGYAEQQVSGARTEARSEAASCGCGNSARYIYSCATFFGLDFDTIIIDTTQF